MAELTDKQKKFCEEYLIDLNATQAAIRAGYSEDSAAVIGCENLIKPNIQEYIQKKQKALSEKTGITHEMLLAEYAKIAFIDIREYYDQNGNLLMPHELSDKAAAALAGIDIDEIYEFINGSKQKIGETKKIKLQSKLSALDSIGKHLGFFAVDNSQKAVNVSMPAINVYNQGPPLANSENDIDV